jgi:hypothetical protein
MDTSRELRGRRAYETYASHRMEPCPHAFSGGGARWMPGWETLAPEVQEAWVLYGNGEPIPLRVPTPKPAGKNERSPQPVSLQPVPKRSAVKLWGR